VVLHASSPILAALMALAERRPVSGADFMLAYAVGFEAGVRTGGDTELLGNAEYIVPLPLNIRLASFFDTGNVYGFSTKFDPTDLRYAAGAGVRWLSPIGPLRIELGRPFNTKPHDQKSLVLFSFGAPFQY